MPLQHPQSQTKQEKAINYKIDFIALAWDILNPDGFLIRLYYNGLAISGEYCVLVELHREGSANKGYLSILFLNHDHDHDHQIKVETQTRNGTDLKNAEMMDPAVRVSVCVSVHF